MDEVYTASIVKASYNDALLDVDELLDSIVIIANITNDVNYAKVVDKIRKLILLELYKN